MCCFCELFMVFFPIPRKKDKVSIPLQSLKKKKDKFLKLVFLQSLWKGTVLVITFSTTHQAQGTVPMLEGSKAAQATVFSRDCKFLRAIIIKELIIYNQE